jgi:hypothetical protein
MKWRRLKLAVVAIVFVPITYCLVMQAAFTILSAIFPFVLGLTFGVSLMSGCVVALCVIRPCEE